MPSQELYCPKCNALIPEGQRICPECNFDLAEYDKEAEQEFQELLNAANKKLSEDTEDNFEDIDAEEAPAEETGSGAITQNQIDALLGGEVVDLTAEEEPPPKKEKKKKKEKEAPAPAPAPAEEAPTPAAVPAAETAAPEEAPPAPAPTPAEAAPAAAEEGVEAPPAKKKKEKKPKPPKQPKAPKAPKEPKAPKAPKEKKAKEASGGAKSFLPFVITVVAAVVAAALGFCIALFFFTDFMHTSEENFAITSANAVNSKLNMNERLCVYKAYVKNSSSGQECLLYAVIDYNGKASVTRYRVVVSKDEPNVINIYYPVDETSQAYIDMKNSSDPGTRVQASVLKNYSDLIESADREISMGSDLWTEIDISRINSAITSEQSRNTTYSK